VLAPLGFGQVLPGLVGVTLPAIARAIGMSRSAAARVRSGRCRIRDTGTLFRPCHERRRGAGKVDDLSRVVQRRSVLG
jgi:hypothetical protein